MCLDIFAAFIWCRRALMTFTRGTMDRCAWHALMKSSIRPHSLVGRVRCP